MQPFFRDRLIDALDRAGVPAAVRQAYVASMTSRAPQTVSRWFDPTKPGLPDLESFVRLCAGLGCSCDTLLGVKVNASATGAALAGSANLAAWTAEILQSLRCECSACDVVQMSGDEMAPAVRDGDLMFVDRGCRSVRGGGIYLLQLAGRQVVRRVEEGPGPELTLRCEQSGYRVHRFEDDAAAVRMGLRVLGKVFGVVALTRLRHG